MYAQLGISSEVYDFGHKIEESLKERFEKFDKTAEYNQMKVLLAMQKNKVSAECFGSSSGYGYDDIGRETLEKVYADTFHTEACLVRPQVTCGTHALAIALFGNLRPGDELLAPAGKPYDTLEEVIGIRPSKGSLAEYGVTYRQVELLEDGTFDYDSIRIVGLLLGMEKEANDKFSAIEKRYNELKALTTEGQVKKRPIVFSGEIHGGNWYAVGGKSFLAQLFKDAGADYFLKDDDRSGGVTLDFETIYNQADDADYWRIVNSYPGTYSYEALKEQDPRYADFRAFKEKGVIYCNMREKPFYESMPTEPEVVLADLLHIFHPDLLPDHTPVYYDLLK